MNPFEHYLASVNRDWMFDDDNRPTFGLLFNCIMYARDTGNTLPKEVLDDLVDLMELLRSGRDVEVFKIHHNLVAARTQPVDDVVPAGHKELQADLVEIYM